MWGKIKSPWQSSLLQCGISKIRRDLSSSHSLTSFALFPVRFSIKMSFRSTKNIMQTEPNTDTQWNSVVYQTLAGLFFIYVFISLFITLYRFMISSWVSVFSGFHPLWKVLHLQRRWRWAPSPHHHQGRYGERPWADAGHPTGWILTSLGRNWWEKPPLNSKVRRSPQESWSDGVLFEFPQTRRHLKPASKFRSTVRMNHPSLTSSALEWLQDFRHLFPAKNKGYKTF